MFALAAALSGFAMSFAITYKSDGLYEGLSVGEQKLDEHFAAEHAFGEKVQFSGGMGTYQRFSTEYGWLTWLFGVCVIAAVLIRFSPHIHVTIISFGCAGFANLSILYKLRSLIYVKATVEAFFWEAPRNAFAKATIAYDWVLAALAVSFFVLMLTAMIFSWKSSRNAPA
jgi:hypothetical protein